MVGSDGILVTNGPEAAGGLQQGGEVGRGEEE